MANQPNIRFKGFTEEWSSKTIGEQLFEINEKNNPKQTDFVVSLTVKDGVIPYSEKGAVGNRAKEDHSQYKLTYPNTIVLNSMNILIGAIGICNYYGCVSPIYYVYRAVEDVCLSFVYRHMSSKRFQKNLRKYGNGILEIRLKVPTEDLMKRILPAPSEKEQKRIAKCFDDLDKLISQREKELEKLKNIKRSLLEKLFPQNGEKIPALRFKEFAEKWEEKKADDIFVSFYEKNHPELPVLSATQDRGMVVREDIGYSITHNKSNEVTYKRVLPGQFVIHLRSFQGGFAHSNVEGITSPAYDIFGFRSPNMYDDYFWKYIFSSERFIKRLTKVTYGIRDGRNVNYNEFLELQFLVPSFDEQQKIARLITILSNLLSLREKQLTLLKHTKQALLEQMFVNE